MNVGQFNNILSCDCASWNAHRLVNEYVKIAWMVNDTVPFKNLPWDNQVRILRVTSVIRAYLGLESCMFEPFDIIGSVFLNSENKDVLSHSEFSNADLTLLKQKLCQTTEEKWRMEHLLRHFQTDSDREQLLTILLRYRIAIEDFENMLSVKLDKRTGTYIGINVVQNLYHPVINNCNNIMDDMIVLLLGNTFKRAFTERELIERFDYPIITDRDLFEWRINN